jgi:cyclic pyranopterin monophosphate synthase
MSVPDATSRFDRRPTATARCGVRVSPDTITHIHRDEADLARVMYDARTAALLAVRHIGFILVDRPVTPPSSVQAHVELGADHLAITVSVATHGAGAEVQALAGASAGALALFAALRPHDATCQLEAAVVLTPEARVDTTDTGGQALRAAVLVMSDSIAAGTKADTSGRLIKHHLEALDVDVVDYRIIPDDEAGIVATLRAYADEQKIDLVMTTGGTGLSPRDRTPEAMSQVIEREAPGITEAARAYGQERTPFAMLSRGRSGVRGDTLIVNLPGSRRGVAESLEALMPWLLHAFRIMRGGGHT